MVQAARVNGKRDAEVRQALTRDGAPAAVSYSTAKNLDARFVKRIPTDCSIGANIVFAPMLSLLVSASDVPKTAAHFSV